MVLPRRFRLTSPASGIGIGLPLLQTYGRSRQQLESGRGHSDADL